MGHLSIAIIKKESSKSTKETKKYEYLVIQKSKKYNFFDVTDNVIGGTFDFSTFISQINIYFELPVKHEDTFETIDFKDKKLFKFNEQENATAYEYELSKPQYESINKNISSVKDKWADISWKNEEELKNLIADWALNQKFIFVNEKPFENPKFSNDLRASITNIVKSNSNGKLIIFAGAGVSFDSNVPGWSALIDELKNDLDNSENDFLDIGQLYYAARGNKEYQEKIREVLKFGKTQFNLIHKKIIDLKPIHIVTTNYDTHFEQALNTDNSKYSIIRKDSDLPYSVGESLLIKMHGDFEQKNLVLKTEDYEQYSKRFPLIEGYIKGLFASKLVLFVGFSFSDPNLKSILNSVNEILKEDSQRPYFLFIPDIKKSQEEIEKSIAEIEAKGLKVVTFEENPFNDYYTQIKTNDDETNLDKLKLTGQKVYKFLRIIEEFDITAESLENLTIKDQFINSILRFKELGSIHPQTLETIYPFKLKHAKYNSSSNAEFDYSNFHLETLNEDLLTFLDKNLGKDKKLNFLSYEDNLKSSQDNAFNKALRLIYESGVSCIIRKNDTSPIHHKLIPINSKEKCNCLKCLLKRSEYSNLFDELNIISNKFANYNDTQVSDLALAFVYHKTGQHLKAFYVLEDLKNSSWNKQEFITYFLANYNQTLLHSFMWYPFNKNVSEKELNSVSQKIKNIDLDTILYELPVDEDIKKLLKLIKENSLFNSTLNTVEENLIKIKEQYKNYNEGGYQSFGPDYWYLIETKFYLLSNFYKQNLLFKDDSLSFCKLANQYIEAIIISFATSDEYKQKVKQVSDFFALVFVEYATPKNNKELLINYKIESINFDDFDKIKKLYFEGFESFLSSGYKETHFFSLEVDENQLYNTSLANSHYFENKIKDKFNNFLMILSKFKLSEHEANSIIVKILNYLSVSNSFSAHKSLEYFIDFVILSIKLFSNENLKKIADYIISDNIWGDDLIEIYCDAVHNKKGVDGILNQGFYTKMFRRTGDRKKWSLSIEKMIPFYCLLEENPKLEFAISIKQSILRSEFNDDSIRKSYYWGVWNPIDDKEIWNLFTRIVLKKSKQFPDYEIGKNGLPIEIKGFDAWNYLHFAVDIIYKHDLFKEKFVNELIQNIDSKLFKWILKPDEFDYKDFKLNWLIPFKNNNIISKIKKIDSLLVAIENGLKNEYNATVAKIYYESILSPQC